MRIKSSLVFVVATLALLACQTDSNTLDGDSARRSNAPSYSDASVKMAAMNNCPHFRNIMVDAQDGVLTTAEFRWKIGEVRDGFMFLRAENNAESQRVWRIVNRLYGAITPPYDVEVGRTELQALSDVCNKYGY